MKPYRLIASLFVLTVFLTACNLPGGGTISEADAVRFAQETLQAQLDAGEVLPQGQAAPPAADDPANQPPADDGNGTATATDVSPSAATPTTTGTPASGGATVSVTTATNCRSGPGVPHAINGALSPGQTANITAQASVSNYVIIQNPGSGPDCWLWLQHATISGDISGLPVVTPPPTPTPTFTPTLTLTPTLAFTQTPTLTTAPTMDWNGTWNAFDTFQFSLTIIQTGNAISATGGPTGFPTYTFTGSVSADGLSATGSYTTSAGGTGTFFWQVFGGSLDQFNGNQQWNWGAGGTGEFCGWRNGAAQPNPCKAP